jgi:nucleoside 2-deoxyribosyltransferase
MINVHIIASQRNVVNDIETLRKISDVITGEKHSVLDNWVEVTYDLRVKQNAKGEALDWASIYASNLENIAKADVIIAETSYDTFGVGYQVALAVQQKKPVLLLRHKKATLDAFARGIVDSWVKFSEYDEDNVDAIIKHFLDENDITTKDMRFNFFIDRQIYNYLRWSSQKTGKTKAEVLRELVVREIDKKDI